MRIKKFTAENYSKALTQVKKELGEDALILSTRSIRDESEMDAMEGSSQVEITTAIENPAQKNNEENFLATEENYESANDSFFNERKDPCLKTMLFSLFSQTERARSLGLQSHQLELFAKLVQRGRFHNGRDRFDGFYSTDRSLLLSGAGA